MDTGEAAETQDIPFNISDSILDSIDPDINHFNDNVINFKSYSIEDLKNSELDTKDSFNIFHNNSRSILKDGRLDEYTILLNMMKNPFHVIAFTETWLSADNLSVVNIDGYESCHTIRPVNQNFDNKSKGGGISVFVKNDIDFKLRHDLNIIHPCVETLFIEVRISNIKYLIGTVYRVPNTNVNEFNEIINGLVEPLKRDSEVILVGDYNVCLLQNNNHTRSFCNTMQSNNLFPVILEPTRVATIERNGVSVNTQTLIDNIFINTKQNFKSGLIHSSISDHYPIFISIKKDNTAENSPQEVKYRLIDDHTIRKFKFAINIALQQLIIDELDAATAFNKFYELMNELYNKYFPIKTKIITNKSLKKPWVSDILVRRIEIRENMAKLAKRGQIEKRIYNEFRNAVTKQLRKAKATYHNNEFSKCKDDIKKTWELINKTIKKNNLMSKIIIKENNAICKSEDLPNKFIKHFTDSVQKLVSDIPTTNNSPNSYLKNRNPNSFFLSHVLNDEVSDVISDMKDNGRSIFKFSTRVLSEVKGVINEKLATIINLCVSQGYFPSQLKTGCITPVYKKGDKSNINNYRPVCSLSPLSKIIEKIIYNRMIKFMEINHIFSNTQFGFRKKMSTETALMEFTDYIQDGLTNKQFVGSMFMDLSKAFDVMNHNILKSKLEHYGFRGNFLNFIMNFLENREYFVNVNGHNSNPVITNIGVPQGSTLGPLLFLIYVNDMKNCSNLLKFIQFADDTTILLKNIDFNLLKRTLETEAKKVINWLICNKLIINLTKTQSMLFTLKRGIYSLNLSFDGTLVEEKKETTFLGLIIDNKLNWKGHIAHVCNKISKSIAILRFLKTSFPKRILKMIYMSLIHSHINYCNLIWGAAEKSNLLPILLLQKKAIRIINMSGYLDESQPIFKSLGILTIYQLYLFNCLLFMHKCIKQNQYPYFKQKIIQNSNIHNYETRHGDSFILRSRPRLNLCQRAFLNMGLKAWNKLDNNVTKYGNYLTYKAKLKIFLLNDCEFTNITLNV